MHIYCPKCNVGYEIDELLIKDEQKRLKCSNCGAVFAAGELKFEIEVDKDGDNADAEPFDLLHAAMLEDNIVADEESPKEESVILDSEDKALEEEPKETEKQVVDEEDEFEAKESFEEKNDVIENSDDDEEPVDLNSIFERLSEHTEHLMVQEKKLPFYEKIWLQIKNILGFQTFAESFNGRVAETVELQAVIGKEFAHVAAERKKEPGIFPVRVTFQKPEGKEIVFIRIVFPTRREVGKEPEVAPRARVPVHRKRPDHIGCGTSVRSGFRAPERAQRRHRSAFGIPA